MRFTPALAILYLVVATQCVRAEDAGIIQGRVLNAANGDGLAGVVVEIRSGRPEPQTATSNESGAFRFTGLKNGGYGYTATRAGYKIWSISSSGPMHGSDPVYVEINMAEPVTLSGHVLDDTGQPAAHVCVQIQRRTECDVFTDTAGAFRFSEVQPGVYSLVAKPQQEDLQRAKRSDGLALIATNFPSIVEREFAEPILVRPGAHLPEFEIRLRASRVYKLGGNVLDAAGNPVPGAKLRLLASLPSLRENYVWGGDVTVIGPARPEEEFAISSTADGSFEFNSVPPGEWIVQAELDPVRDPVEREIEPSASESITVSSHDLDGIVLHLADPFKLEYSLDWGQSKPPDRRSASSLNLIPEEGQSFPPIPGEPRSFDELVPGRYRVAPTYMEGFYVSSATLNGQEVFQQDVQLAPGASIKIVYKPSSRLRGTVEAKVASTVMLLSASTARGELIDVRTAAVTAGAFEIANVPPGDYVIAAFDRADALFLETPSMIDRIVPKATAVRVREGETSTVQLKLSPSP